MQTFAVHTLIPGKQRLLELRTVLSTLSSGRVPVLILLAIVSLF